MTRIRSRSSTARAIPGGYVVAPGETVEVDDELAAGLLAQPDRWQRVAVAEPPRSGAGSGRKAWAEYAAALNVEYPGDASRDAIIAAVEAAEQQE